MHYLCATGQDLSVQDKINQIKDPIFARWAKYYYTADKRKGNALKQKSNPTLPFTEGKMISRKQKRGNSYGSAVHLSLDKLPLELRDFASGKEKPLENRRGVINVIFMETSGDYLIVSYSFFTTDFFESKKYLFTYDYEGNLIDHLEFFNSIEASPNNINTIEGVLNKDMTVDVYKLVFDQFPVVKENQSTMSVVENLQGQRIDCSYQITKDGKFRLISQHKYIPQIYKKDYLTSHLPISKGNEVILNN